MQTTSQVVLYLNEPELELLTEALELADLTGDLDATEEEVGAMHERLTLTALLRDQSQEPIE